MEDPAAHGQSAVELSIRFNPSLHSRVRSFRSASMFGAKAEIALREKRLAFELVMGAVDKADRLEPRHPDVLRVNPKQQASVLIHGELGLFGSTLIFEYLEMAFPERPSGLRTGWAIVRGSLRNGRDSQAVA